MSHYQIHPSEPHLCPCQTAVTSWKPGGWGCLAGFQLPGMSAGWVGTAVAQGDTHRHTGLAIWPRTQGWEPGRERDKACPGNRTSGVLFISLPSEPCPPAQPPALETKLCHTHHFDAFQAHVFRQKREMEERLSQSRDLGTDRAPARNAYARAPLSPQMSWTQILGGFLEATPQRFWGVGREALPTPPRGWEGLQWECS